MKAVKNIHAMVTLAGLLILLSSCGGRGPDKGQFYEGPPLSSSSLALITYPDPFFLPPMEVLSIDGLSVPFRGYAELLPGGHRVRVAYDGETLQGDPVDLSFEVEAGHIYELFPVLFTHKPGWYPSIRDVTWEMGHFHRRALMKKLVRRYDAGREEGPGFVLPDMPEKNGKPLPQSGQWQQTSVSGRDGVPAYVEYRYDRYTPFVLGEAAGGSLYHLEISLDTGEVIRVLGVGQRKGDEVTFEPLPQRDEPKENRAEGTVRRVTRDRFVAPFFTDTKGWHSVRFRGIELRAKLDEDTLEDLSGRAEDALILAANGQGDKLMTVNGVSANLSSRLTVNTMEYRLGVQALALDIAAEAVRVAREVAGLNPPEKEGYALAAALLDRTEDNYKDCKAEDARLRLIPALEADATQIKIFSVEDGLDDRRYSREFSLSSTRMLGWELHLSMPAAEDRRDYMVSSIWIGPEGKVLARQLHKASCLPGKTDVKHAGFWGWKEPGRWQPGKYSVSLSVGGKKVGAANFEIVEDLP